MSAGEEHPAEGTAAAAAAFGRWLSQERELRGLARDEVAKLTRLAPAVIASLESGDPVRMPPKAYVFGYLRTYAGAVGLDADDVVLRWQEVVGPEESARAPRPRVPVKALVALAVALAAAAVVALTLLGRGGGERAPLKLERPRAVERAPYAPDPGR